MKKYIKQFYGKKPLKNKYYVRIIHDKHFNRLCRFLTNGTIIHDGKINNEHLLIEPTLLDEITWNDAIMQEEIFGPILPILTFDNLDEVVSTVTHNDKSLALYYFSSKEKTRII